MANEIYKANDVQLRQQIKAHLDEADSDISALDTRVTQNESDIDDLEAADVVQDGRLESLEGYRPGFMKYDGSTGYYNATFTSSGNKVVCVFSMRCEPFIAGSTNRKIVHVEGNPNTDDRILVTVFADDDPTTALQNKLAVRTQNTSGATICQLISLVEVCDGEEHVVFYSFDADAGTAVLYIDGIAAIDSGNAAHIAPTTGTLATGAGSPIYVGSLILASQFYEGMIGFFGYHDAYRTNYTDFMTTGGVLLDIDPASAFGATPLYYNPNGQMHRNLGSAGDMTLNGLITPYFYGLESAWTEPDEALEARIETLENEEVSGTFTPTIQDSSLSDSEGQTYTNQTGYYIKRGSIVYFWLDVTINSLGTMTGGDNAVIAGLPFTSNANVRSACSVGIGLSLAITAGVAVTAYVVNNTNHIALLKWSATAGTPPLTITEISTGGRLMVSGNYFV